MRVVSLMHQGRTRVAVVESSSQLRLVDHPGDLYAMAVESANQSTRLVDFIRERQGQSLVDYAQALDLGRVQVPCMHPDPAHCLVSGTGLTHTGSADTRNAMHAKLAEGNLSDSMKMFQQGLEGGKPVDGSVGAEPEWFYKGDGSIVVPPGAPLEVPAFAEDAGEEPEIAGIYLIDAQGKPQRLGFCLGNEFSDHIKERRNYLLLAHSKLRPCSLGPEMLLDELPGDLAGVSRIIRGGKVLWEKDFLTGEENMVHSLSNLEHHHFKYAGFRRPGDLHIHFFGTATLSFADDVRTQDGDVFEISMPVFGRPLRNPVKWAST